MAARILTSFAQLDVLFCSASLFVVICFCVSLAIVYHNIITGPELLLFLVVVGAAAGRTAYSGSTSTEGTFL